MRPVVVVVLSLADRGLVLGLHLEPVVALVLGKEIAQRIHHDSPPT